MFGKMKLCFIAITALTLLGCNSVKEPSLSSDAFIENFIFEENEIIVKQPSIVKGNPEISFIVKYGATDESLNSLVPRISLSAGAIIDPPSGSPRDFSSGMVNYTVTAADGRTTNNYYVRCLKEANTEAKILDFILEEDFIAEEPVINEIDKEIIFYVLPGTQASSLGELAPEIVVSPGATIIPSSGVLTDFSKGAVNYTVTAQDNKHTSVYEVKWDILPSSDAMIIDFSFENDIVISQPVLQENGTEFIFYVGNRASKEEIDALVPQIYISPGAEIFPKSGIAQPFSWGEVRYTVVSYDKSVEKTYTVRCLKLEAEEAKILSFTFDDDIVVSQPVISEENKTIEFEVEPSASPDQIKDLRPNISLSPGAASTVSTGTTADFTRSPVLYTVTSLSGKSTQTYSVYCRRKPNTRADILSIYIDHPLIISQPEIKEDDAEIEFHVSTETSLADMGKFAPVIVSSPYSVITPPSGTRQDFSKGVVEYTVISEDGLTTNKYFLKCIKSPNRECNITDVYFDDPEGVIEIQPVIQETDTEILFYVSPQATAEQISRLVPQVNISSGASISPEPGPGFSAGKSQVYMVTAENGSQKEYRLKCVRLNRMVFDFDEWISTVGTAATRPEPAGWATSNEDIDFILRYSDLIGYDGDFTAKPSYDNKTGRRAIEITTQDTKGGSGILSFVPKISAGLVFLGSYERLIENNGLNSAKYGVDVNYKPLKIRGYYKYSPGADYYRNKESYPEGSDAMLIYAVLFEAENDLEVLTGSGLFNSDNIVATAYLSDGSESSDYLFFDLPITYKTNKVYDSGKKYKFSIVMSSSSGYMYHYGAPGSVLKVDSIEVLYE